MLVNGAIMIDKNLQKKDVANSVKSTRTMNTKKASTITILRWL